MAEVAPDTTLRLRRTVQARRTAVFRAWTEPEAIKRWWLPRAGFSVPQVEVDLRTGGRYRILMRNPAGDVFGLAGTYREVKPPERLVYTFRWEKPEMDVGETVVTVDFVERGAATEVVVTHERFPSEVAREQHGQGWTGCLDQLPEACR